MLHVSLLPIIFSPIKAVQKRVQESVKKILQCNTKVHTSRGSLHSKGQTSLQVELNFFSRARSESGNEKRRTLRKSKQGLPVEVLGESWSESQNGKKGEGERRRENKFTFQSTLPHRTNHKLRSWEKAFSESWSFGQAFLFSPSPVLFYLYFSLLFQLS